jgi:hypothetical protein
VSGVDIWTGRTAHALQLALRMTNEGFAERIGASVRTVAKWSANPNSVQIPDLQRALDTMHSQASAEEKERFARMIRSTEVAPVALPEIPASVGDSLRWIDSAMTWPSGEARKRAVALMSEMDGEAFRGQRYRRSGVSRSQVACFLQSYYAVSGSGQHGFYSASVSGQAYKTSILTAQPWLELRAPLGPTAPNLTYKPSARRTVIAFDEIAAHAALMRIAGTLAFGTRLVNSPTYRLVGATVAPKQVAGDLSVIDFVEYALTFDLLENELLDTISAGVAEVAELPLRSRYLPDKSSLLDLANRVCVGGPISLTAIARNRHGRHDYVLLVQERSGHVLNAPGRLAVIPKAFHQPLIDLDEDANIAMTIEREMEEELFGRPEVDLDGNAQRLADPMRIDRLSEPMRWLANQRNNGSWHIECTGYGINAVSGNYEFPCLIVINDETWWEQYGGHIEANWEVGGLHRYSTLSAELLESLIADPRWSNEGLFAFVEGLRRLAELDSERVALPHIEVELHK